MAWCGVVWSWAGAAGDRGGGGNRAAAGRRGRRVTCCFVFSLSSGPVCAAAGRPPWPGEPNQCWIWRWCPSALWGTSNGNSRWVSVGLGSSLGTLFSGLSLRTLPASGLWPFSPLRLPPHLFCPLGPLAPVPRYLLLHARPSSVSLWWVPMPSPQASTGPLLRQ